MEKGSKKAKIAAILVTYNRKTCLEKSVSCLLKQSIPLDKIILVDNASSDETEAYCRTLVSQYPQIQYIRKSENTGGAGGFFTGIKAAVQLGADYVWGMDDDAYAVPDALERLLKHVSPDQIACYWSNCDNDKQFKGAIKEIRDWMFVGFFIPKVVINQVGYPREDFFIYLDDYEYAYRIRKRGYKIYKVRDSVILHTAGTQNMFPPKKVLGVTITWANLPDWKLYYRVRNYILTYSWKDKNKYITISAKMLKMFLMTVLFNYHQIPVFFKAYKDGILGKSGKRMMP